MLRIAKPRLLAASFLFVSLVSSCRKNTKENKLGSEPKDRESYSLGYQLGKSLQSQHTSVNLDAYVSGLREALAGTAPQVGEEELRAAVSDLRNKAIVAKKEELKDKAAKNRAAGQAFLDQNKNKEGVAVLPSGVQYKVLKEGSGKSPTDQDIVTVNYRSTLIDGTEFANSAKQKKPPSVSLSHVIPGWREALLLMKEGSKWQIFVPSDLAYGPKGGSGVEPNSTLIFDVELLRVSPGEEPEARAAVPVR
jgi:FKBP-type peptidyl-prolyl cis-trans isomerase FklB